MWSENTNYVINDPYQSKLYFWDKCYFKELLEKSDSVIIRIPKGEKKGISGQIVNKWLKRYGWNGIVKISYPNINIKWLKKMDILERNMMNDKKETIYLERGTREYQLFLKFLRENKQYS